MSVKHKWCGSAALLCFGLLIASVSSLFAQSAGTGALTGTVKDTSGSVMANVTVTATSNDTTQARTVVTSAAGTYTIPLLAPGSYRLKFEAAGFKTVEIPLVTVVLSETGTVDRELEVGAQSQVVTVTGEVMGVQTANSTIGTDISSQTVSSIPLNTRNYTQILGSGSRNQCAREQCFRAWKRFNQRSLSMARRRVRITFRWMAPAS